MSPTGYGAGSIVSPNAQTKNIVSEQAAKWSADETDFYMKSMFLVE